MKSNTPTLQEHFLALAAKYAVSVPKSWTLEERAVRDRGDSIPLFPWRNERRFVELHRIVEAKTLEDIVLCRFSCTGDGLSSNLNDILYREFDLLEWITGSTIVSVSSSSFENRFSNVLARLESGAVASIEAGTTLPQGTPMLDRHELIARRGVASDRVVDTHVPQQSVYLFEKDGVRSWTDVDAELFGLDNERINAVRAAFDLAKQPTLVETNIEQHRHLTELVAQVR